MLNQAGMSNTDLIVHSLKSAALDNETMWYNVMYNT